MAYTDNEIHKEKKMLLQDNFRNSSVALEIRKKIMDFFNHNKYPGVNFLITQLLQFKMLYEVLFSISVLSETKFLLKKQFIRF